MAIFRKYKNFSIGLTLKILCLYIFSSMYENTTKVKDK